MLHLFKSFVVPKYEWVVLSWFVEKFDDLRGARNRLPGVRKLIKGLADTNPSVEKKSEVRDGISNELSGRFYGTT